MRCVLLFKASHAGALLKRLDPKNTITTVLALEDDGFRELDREFICGLRECLDALPRAKELVFFDCAPLVCALINNQANFLGVKCTFVQHGVVSSTAVRPIRNKAKSALKDLKFAAELIKVFRPRLRTVRLIISYAITGGYRSFKHLPFEVRFEQAFFFSQSDLRTFSRFRPFNSRHKHVVGGRDQLATKIRNSKNGVALYVSQPLVRDGFLSEKKFKDELRSLADCYPNLMVLSHPSFPKDYFSFLDVKACYQDEIDVLLVERIIGHFSTLLYYDYKAVPVEFVSFGSDKVARRIESKENGVDQVGIIHAPRSNDAIDEWLNGVVSL